MAETGIVTINVLLDVTAAAAQDYSTLLIVDCNHSSFSRAAVYASPSDYQNTIPSGTPLRIALDSAFSASVKPSQVIAGKSLGKAVLTPTGVADTVQYDVTVTVAGGGTVAATYTAGAADTEEDVCVGLKADIDAVTAVTDEVTAAVVGTGTDAVLEITPNTTTDDFTLTNLTPNLELESVATEAPGDSLAAIAQYNSQWTWVASTDHTPSYQISMAAAVQPLQKIYVTSTQLAVAYSNWDGVTTPQADDVGANFRFNNYDYAHAMYHNLSDSIYPEMVRVTEFTFLKPGQDNFALQSLSGVGVAQITDGSRALSTTELVNIEARSMATIVDFYGQSVVGSRIEKIGNRVASGKRLETIAVSIYTKQEIERTTATFLLKNRKAAMNDSDIAKLVNRWSKFFQDNASSGGAARAFQPGRPVDIEVPAAKDISFEDKVAGLFQGTVMTAYLDPSIDSVNATVRLTFSDPTEV